MIRLPLDRVTGRALIALGAAAGTVLAGALAYFGGWPADAALFAAVGYGVLGAFAAQTSRLNGSPPSLVSEPAEPIAKLLEAHLALISETSESGTLRLSEGLARLREDLLCVEKQLPPGSIGANSLELATDLQTHLQFQDIIRQQVIAVQTGLECIAGTDVISKDPENPWTPAAIELLESSYVMESQWKIHHVALGRESTQEKAGTETVFF